MWQYVNIIGKQASEKHCSATTRRIHANTTSEGVLYQTPSDPEGCRVGPQDCPGVSCKYLMGLGYGWFGGMANTHRFFVMSLKLLLFSFCAVAGCLILLEQPTALRHMQMQYFFQVTLILKANANHQTAIRWQLLVTWLLSSFSVMIDQCVWRNCKLVKRKDTKISDNLNSGKLCNRNSDFFFFFFKTMPK